MRRAPWGDGFCMIRRASLRYIPRVRAGFEPYFGPCRRRLSPGPAGPLRSSAGVVGSGTTVPPPEPLRPTSPSTTPHRPSRISVSVLRTRPRAAATRRSPASRRASLQTSRRASSAAWASTTSHGSGRPDRHPGVRAHRRRGGGSLALLGHQQQEPANHDCTHASPRMPAAISTIPEILRALSVSRLAAKPDPCGAAQGGSTLSSPQRLSTLDDTNHDHHERNDQENVNESAQCVRGNQTSQPKDDQDDCDGFEHLLLLRPSGDAARSHQSPRAAPAAVAQDPRRPRLS